VKIVQNKKGPQIHARWQYWSHIFVNIENIPGCLPTGYIGVRWLGTFKMYSVCAHWAYLGHIVEYIQNVLSIWSLGTLESHVDCDLNVFTMYPVGIWALVPSVSYCTLLSVLRSHSRIPLWRFQSLVYISHVLVATNLRTNITIFSHWGQGPKYPLGTWWKHWEHSQHMTPMCPVIKYWVYFEYTLLCDSDMPSGHILSTFWMYPVGKQLGTFSIFTKIWPQYAQWVKYGHIFNIPNARIKLWPYQNM